jgi:hypothetical protein
MLKPSKHLRDLRKYFFAYNKKGVGIATSYGLDIPGSIPGNARFFSSVQHTDQLWAPPSLLSDGYQGLFPQEIKQQGHEADHSPPSSLYGIELLLV